MEPTNVLTRAARGPDAVIRYADHVDGVIDVFLPPSRGRPKSTRPVVVFVHGGFWRQEWDRRHAWPLAGALARSGFVVAVPEYRRVGGPGGWPLTAYDVEQALAMLPFELTEVAPGYTQPARPVVLCGHSAGGHLALWAGLRAGEQRVAAIVALAPVSDVRWAARVSMGDGAVQALLGGDPTQRPNEYAEADVVPLLDASLPVTIVQGSADAQVSAAMNRDVAARGDVDYVELDGVDHFALIDPLSPAFVDVVLPRLRTAAGNRA